MKKILLVTRPLAPPWDEASKNFAYDLVKNLPTFSFGVLGTKNFLKFPENVKLFPIYSSASFGWKEKGQLLINLKRLQKEFDITHFLFTPTRQNSFLIKNFIKNRNGKTIQTVATLREDLYSNKGLKKIFFSDWIVTYSDYAKTKLKSLGFENVERIYPGINLEKYKKNPKSPVLMKKYGFQEEDFILNFTGEYSRLMAIDTVISAFLNVSRLIPRAKLSLAVRVKNHQDKKKKAEIMERLKKNNLLTKAVFHDDGKYLMPEIYNLCDVSLFPVQNMQGKFDIPLAVIEAMACEKPVILSDLPLLQEIAKTENSVTIEKGNLEQLIQKIRELHNFPEKRIVLGKAARKFVSENFDIQKIAEKYKTLYQNL